jgi:hypothetical protein
MFGRRRHAAVAVAPIVAPTPAEAPRPRLAEERIFELVHAKIAAVIGEGGEWVVRRRTPEDTDELFRTVLAHQVALDVTTALRNAQLELESAEPARAGSGESADVGVVFVAAPAAGVEHEETESADAAEHVPAHRHDDPDGDDEAVLDEDALALQWEPAPITVWTDLKKPVTGPIAVALTARLAEKDLVVPGR